MLSVLFSKLLLEFDNKRFEHLRRPLPLGCFEFVLHFDKLLVGLLEICLQVDKLLFLVRVLSLQGLELGAESLDDLVLLSKGRVGGAGISQPATQPANDALMLSNRRNRTNRFSLPGINHMGRRFTFHRRPGETRLSCGLDVLLESVLLKLDPRLRRGRLQVSPAVE